MAIRGVLFDWDGTLVYDEASSFARPCQAVAGMARGLGIAIDGSGLEGALTAVMPAYVPGVTLTSPHIDDLLRDAFAHAGHEVTAPELVSYSRCFFDAAVAGQRLFDDARAILASLRMRGYAVGVVTNTIFPGTLVASNLSRLGIAGYIDAIVTSVDAGVGKPHPAPYVAALEALQLTPDEAIFVGDRVETDMTGAHAVGLMGVLINRDARPATGGDFPVIQRLSSLNTILGESTVG